jgi:hypothetical protein
VIPLAGGGSSPHLLESAPFWLLLLEEYVPVFAAAVVTVVLARSGFANKMSEYRKDTMDLVRLRAETLEKELVASQLEVQELTREVRTRDRRIESLEDEVDGLRYGERPARSARTRRTPHTDLPPPHRAPDVDDGH